MTVPTGYLICGTPRTGSTLLCGLLASTGVLGRPESYFREADEADWASRLAVTRTRGRVADYAEFARAVRTAATTGNGVFAARVMWGSLGRVVGGLSSSSDESDLDVLEAAFGPLAFVHLRRRDDVAQAVSWARAEQTGYWQPGDTVTGVPQQDLDQMVALVETIRAHDAAWQSWFDSQGIRPTKLTYEELAPDPRGTVEAVAERIGVALPVSWQPVTPHRKQADHLNDCWAAALRAVLGGQPR